MEDVHDNDTELVVCPVELRRGAVGACVSPAEFVVTDNMLLAGEIFPAASIAFTVKLYEVLTFSMFTM